MPDFNTGSILGDATTGASLGSVIPGVGTLVGGLGGAALGVVSGLFGKKKANNILANNPRPTEAIPSEVLANQQIAQGAALQGMPSEQYDQAQKNIQRNQSAALTAASTTPGGGVRNIGAIQQASNDASGQLNAESAEMRRQNISQLLGANNQVASWKDKLFDWNERQKYIQQYNYGMGLLGQSNQNLLSGADKLLGTAAGAAASGLFGSNGTSKTPSAGRNPDIYTPSTADTSGGYNSPANNYPTINTPAPNYLNQ